MSVPLDTSIALRREQVVLCDLLSSEQVSLRPVWEDLVLNACRVVDAFFTNERCYLILERRLAMSCSTPCADTRFLQRIVAGESQNVIAIESEQAASTVGVRARKSLLGLGVEAKPSRIHPLLMLAASTAAERSTARLAKRATLAGTPEMVTLSIERPELVLIGHLPRAEAAIASYLVEGISYDEMAKRRGTSTRTIANQVASVFRRFRVSGRNDLVLRMMTEGLRALEDFASARPTRLVAAISPPVQPHTS